MSRILVINGPNLNNLGQRAAEHYGATTLSEIESAIVARGRELGADVTCFQSNHEGALVDFLQENAPAADGIVINPAALTTYGYSLADALRDTDAPIIEVHISNIHAREEFRRHSLFSGIAVGQVVGFGWRGYLHAVEHLVHLLDEDAPA